MVEAIYAFKHSLKGPCRRDNATACTNVVKLQPFIWVEVAGTRLEFYWTKKKTFGVGERENITSCNVFDVVKFNMGPDVHRFALVNNIIVGSCVLVTTWQLTAYEVAPGKIIKMLALKMDIILACDP